MPKVDITELGRKARHEAIERKDKLENVDSVKITWNLHLSPTTSNLRVMDDLQENCALCMQLHAL